MFFASDSEKAKHVISVLWICLTRTLPINQFYFLNFFTFFLLKCRRKN